MTALNIQDAIAAIRSGDRENGAGILSEILQENPGSEAAWMWMSACVNDLEEKKNCLRKVLEINPANEQACLALQKLEEQSAPLPTLEEIQSFHVRTQTQQNNDPTQSTADFATVSCINCSTELHLTSETDLLICPECGMSYSVRRDNGLIFLVPVLSTSNEVISSVETNNQEIQVLKNGVNRTAAELAVNRLKQDFVGVSTEIEKNSKWGWQASGLFIFGAFSLLIAFGAGLNNWFCLSISCGSTALGVLGFISAIALKHSSKEQLTKIEAELAENLAIINQNGS